MSTSALPGYGGVGSSGTSFFPSAALNEATRAMLRMSLTPQVMLSEDPSGG